MCASELPLWIFWLTDSARDPITGAKSVRNNPHCLEDVSGCTIAHRENSSWSKKAPVLRSAGSSCSSA